MYQEEIGKEEAAKRAAAEEATKNVADAAIQLLAISSMYNNNTGANYTDIQNQSDLYPLISEVVDNSVLCMSMDQRIQPPLTPHTDTI